MDASTIAANIDRLRELRLKATREIDKISYELDVLSLNFRSEVQQNWIGVASQEYQRGLLDKTNKIIRSLNNQSTELTSVMQQHIARLERAYQEALKAAKTVNE